MRTLLALLAALLILAPGAIAEETADYAPMHGCTGTMDSDGDGEPDNMDPECHDHDSPGFGILAGIAALGAVAFVARRRA